MLGLSLSLWAPVILGRRAWSPADLGAALLADWFSDDASLITAPAGILSSWKDRVTALDLLAAGTAQPTYSPTSWDGSKSSVAIDGVANCLTITPNPLPSGSTPYEVWAVLDQEATAGEAGSKTIFAAGDNSATTRTLTRLVPSAVNRASIIAGNGSSGLGRDQSTIDFSGKHVVRAQYGATQSYIAVDGNISAVLASVLSTSAARFRVGASSNATPVNFGKFKLRRLIVTNPLSQADALKMLAYLGKEVPGFVGGTF